MGRSEKISVKATDSLSIYEKKKEFEDIEFVMYNRMLLEKLQAESGVQLIPQDMKIPADKEE